MDEVENPDLPAAGESSPTLRPAEDYNPGEVPDRASFGDAVEPENLLVGTARSNPAQPLLPQPNHTFTLPTRPGLKRESSAPPPQQPPPAPPGQSNDHKFLTQDPPDSLTLADLRRIRSTFPTLQSPPKVQLLETDKVYDFEYQDAQSLPVELEEWFSYGDVEEMRLRKCKCMFSEAWKAQDKVHSDWSEVTEDSRRSFVKREIDSLQSSDGHATASLLILTYLALGVWEETAGRQEGCTLQDLFSESGKGGSRLEDYSRSSLQIQWIVAMVDTIHSSGGLQVIYDALRKNFEESFAVAPIEPLRNEASPKRQDESTELWCCLTLMYLFIEVARVTGAGNGKALKNDILSLEPHLLNYLTQLVARLRWDDSAPVPLTKMLLMAWKAILIFFGGTSDVDRVKRFLREDVDEIDDRGQPVITASPLDYHLFRQEINSKYPAYQPPPPIFPLEPENNSILPPLRHRRVSYAPSEIPYTGAPHVGTHSIMHQPVHIATPAPSPPPSPAGPGKAGKKQNYQTNQMFPFFYPPLDSSSNELGGKGSTELQDLLVGRKWEGSDVPTSILEAAELFAKRMRATRAMRQLWEARVDYMRYERGWKADDENVDVDDFELLPKPAPEESAEQGQPIPQTEEEKTLEAVSRYYRDSLPHLQSLVIVVLKAVLQSVTDQVTKNGPNGLQAGIQFSDGNGTSGQIKSGENGAPHTETVESAAEELDKLRGREISAKALSAILLLLLKWFKVSHILQYEYLTQLLLDSNYVPLVLKLWQTQEIGRACHHRTEKEESNFFYLCQASSRQGAPPKQEVEQDEAEEDAEESEDEAAPPPIKLTRQVAPEEPESATLTTGSPSAFHHPPEIDELGYPQTALPSEPLKEYSYRNIFSSINYLRILQKVTRRKTHRALLLVSYKSSSHLKKTLKVPIWPLRYYTLKLFKSQVPFCGRKWRHGNMKIITAVWLSVPAEFRDDWLTGGGGGMGGACIGDVDGTVEDALPLEQALRNLTHWWNVRNFPEVMGVDKSMLEEDMDYFTRELEKMEVIMREEEHMEEGEDPMVDEEPWQGPIDGY